MKKDLKEMLFDLFEQYEDYESIKECVRSYHSSCFITDEDYNTILENYDTWLREYESQDNNKKSHQEQLLLKCIGYLFEIWNNESTDDIRKSFERLGFTKEDMDYYEINEDLYYIEEDTKKSWERY